MNQEPTKNIDIPPIKSSKPKTPIQSPKLHAPVSKLPENIIDPFFGLDYII